MAAALTGEVIDPRQFGEKYAVDCPEIPQPQQFRTDDGMILPPLEPDAAQKVEIIRGSTIVKPPAGEKLPDPLSGRIAIKVGDKITTDHIMPAGALLKYRSNVPEYAKHVFANMEAEGEKTFAERMGELKAQDVGGVILAGESYGQGSSREHAALCPMHLGVRVVIAKSIERIHQANLVNFAILPLLLEDPKDYDRLEPNDDLQFTALHEAIRAAETLTVRTKKGFEFTCRLALTSRQRKIMEAGGLLNFTRAES